MNLNLIKIQLKRSNVFRLVSNSVWKWYVSGDLDVPSGILRKWEHYEENLDPVGWQYADHNPPTDLDNPVTRALFAPAIVFRGDYLEFYTAKELMDFLTRNQNITIIGNREVTS